MRDFCDMPQEQTSEENDRPTGPLEEDRQVGLVRRAAAHIDEHAGETVSLKALAAALKVSPWHLQRVFKKILGLSPRDYGDALKGRLFREELKAGQPVAQATYGAGYGSASRVYERAAGELGMTPASYAKGGSGAVIHFTIVATPMGRLLVAATAVGICFVALGEDDALLAETLRAEFPAAAEVRRDDAALAAPVASLIDYLSGTTPEALWDLPLDVRATAFQRRVWQQLLAIPYGETRSYAEIAQRLGIPKGQRAVGRACATNPIALLVPCHRAQRSDGKLAGYRWGLNRKQALLTLEARLAAEAAGP